MAANGHEWDTARSTVRLQSFSLSCEDAQAMDDWRLRIKDETGS